MKVSALATMMAAPATSLANLPKLVLIDRDGVINEDVGSPGVIFKSQFRLTNRAGHAIGLLKRCGCQVAVVTNQSCVGKGLLTTSELNDIHFEMKRLLLEQDKDASIDMIYVCTSSKDDPRKKPNPGMIVEACQDFQVDPAVDCVFIGDTLTDLQAAAAGGIERRILVQTGYGFSLMGNIPASNYPQLIRGHDSLIKDLELRSVAPFYYATNLAAAVDYYCLS